MCEEGEVRSVCVRREGEGGVGVRREGEAGWV